MRQIEQAFARARAAGKTIAAMPVPQRMQILNHALALLMKDGRDEFGQLVEQAQQAGFTEATAGISLLCNFLGWRDNKGRPLLLHDAASFEFLHMMLDEKVGPLSAEDKADIAAKLEPVPFPVAAVLCGGAAPAPAIEQMFGALLCGTPVVIRAAKAAPQTPRIVQNLLRESAPEFAEAVQPVHFARDEAQALRAFCNAPCVVATGNDATLQAVQKHVPAGARFVGYGNKLSVAVIAAGEEEGEAAHHLSWQAALWDQLGCLSPVAAFALGGKRGAAQLAEATAAKLAEHCRIMPRGEVPPEAQAATEQARREAQMRGARVLQGADWTVVLETDSQFRGSPLYRFLRVHPVGSRAEARFAQEALGDSLSTIGLHGLEFADEAEPAGGYAFWRAHIAVRYCLLESMQSPAGNWTHNGLGVLWPFAEFQSGLPRDYPRHSFCTPRRAAKLRPRPSPSAGYPTPPSPPPMQ